MLCWRFESPTCRAALIAQFGRALMPRKQSLGSFFFFEKVVHGVVELLAFALHVTLWMHMHCQCFHYFLIAVLEPKVILSNSMLCLVSIDNGKLSIHHVTM